MSSLLNYFFNPLPNAIMTGLLGLSALYWLITFLSGDFLGDWDMDLDTDAGVDHDLSEAGSSSFISKALEFINVGKVPIMVIVSVFKFVAWIFTLASSMLWNLASWGWKSVLILIPVFMIAFIFTRWLTKPFIKIYQSMGYNGEDQHDLLGRIAVLKSNIANEKLGTAELAILNDVLKIVVKSKSGKPIAYNSQISIVGESPDKKFYWVEPEITLNNITNN
jgi:membrane protein implicated in regulation of membrane protease activity